MEVLMLAKDGRCKWLESKVLDGLFPTAVRMAANPFAKKLYLVVAWISNDRGRVGVDLKWFKSLGVPAVPTYTDLPSDTSDIRVVNTGYDSIVTEERQLRARGVDIVDSPCPFVRKLRRAFEENDPAYQYVFLCESNHITVKNFAAIFPPDMLLVQMNNYRQVITQGQLGKPLRVVPYVTYMEDHGTEILDFVNRSFPDRRNDKLQTRCMWVRSKVSPIVEIGQLPEAALSGIREALLLNTAGSTNKSVASLHEALERRGLVVTQIGSFRQFLGYARRHASDKVLLTRAPIPNTAEAPILAYLDGGLASALRVMVGQHQMVQRVAVRFGIRARYVRNLVFRKRARQEAAREGLLKEKYRV